MIILGIDPGTATTGYGVLKVHPSNITTIEFGLIETNKELPPETRLRHIYDNMFILLNKFKPETLIIEKVFFATNAKTAIRVGQAQGVLLLSAADANIPVVEYAPGTIKKEVTGSGRADKKQVIASVEKILGAHKDHAASRVTKKTHYDNAADALAVGLCHIFKTTDHAI